MTEIDVDTIRDALDRIARTPDGAVLYRYLQKVAIGLPDDPDPSEGALRTEFGRRSFAHTLMGLMAKGLDESDGRNATAGGGRSSERPVVFRVREPAASRRKLSIAEWREREQQRTGGSEGDTA